VPPGGGGGEASHGGGGGDGFSARRGLGLGSQAARRNGGGLDPGPNLRSDEIVAIGSHLMAVLSAVRSAFQSSFFFYNQYLIYL
jgi:hypothetical protein